MHVLLFVRKENVYIHLGWRVSEAPWVCYPPLNDRSGETPPWPQAGYFFTRTALSRGLAPSCDQTHGPVCWLQIVNHCTIKSTDHSTASHHIVAICASTRAAPILQACAAKSPLQSLRKRLHCTHTEHAELSHLFPWLN